MCSSAEGFDSLLDEFSIYQLLDTDSVMKGPVNTAVLEFWGTVLGKKQAGFGAEFFCSVRLVSIPSCLPNSGRQSLKDFLQKKKK